MVSEGPNSLGFETRASVKAEGHGRPKLLDSWLPGSQLVAGLRRKGEGPGSLPKVKASGPAQTPSRMPLICRTAPQPSKLTEV